MDVADPVLDPALRELLDAFGEDDAFEVHRARAALDDFAAAVALPRAASTEDGELAGVPVRRYAARGGGPDLVWFHGGGFVTGSLDAVDPLCRAAAERTGGAVLSAAYRLAPEHPFPAALDDAVAVLRAAAQAGPVVAAGDSAGAGLAAAAARVVAADGLPVVGQLLLCPWLDLTLRAPSVARLGRGYGLTATGLRSFAELYLAGAAAADPRCSPLLAPAPVPAVVVTAGLDPLRDDGHAYAARLAEAGVPVAHREWPSMVHGFVGMSSVTPAADEAMGWAVGELQRLAFPGCASS